MGPHQYQNKTFLTEVTLTNKMTTEMKEQRRQLITCCIQTIKQK